MLEIRISMWQTTKPSARWSIIIIIFSVETELNFINWRSKNIFKLNIAGTEIVRDLLATHTTFLVRSLNKLKDALINVVVISLMRKTREWKDDFRTIMTFPLMRSRRLKMIFIWNFVFAYTSINDDGTFISKIKYVVRNLIRWLGTPTLSEFRFFSLSL